MNNQTINIFLPLFEQHLQLLENTTCKKCNATLKNPLLPWMVGSKYNTTKERILFVGKPHRGNSGEKFASGMLNPNGPDLEWLMECSWPYWSYTKEILVNIYGSDDPWDYVALTNIIKCTNVDDGENSSLDQTTYEMAECCIGELGVIFKEIRELKPNTIIFFTYSLYKEFLAKFPDYIGFIADHITSDSHTVKCGQKTLGWWDRRISTPWSENMRVLVTGHPERMKKNEYIDLITKWITD